MDTFEKNLTRLYPMLRAYARSLTGNLHESEDLVQEGMMRALKARASFQEGTNLRAWVMVIMRNHFITLMRRNKKFGMRTLDDPDHPVPSAAVSGNQEDSLELAQVLEAMEHIPARMKLALQLVGMQQLEYDEAAAESGILVGTIKSRVSRGRIALRKKMDEGYKPVKFLLPIIPSRKKDHAAKTVLPTGSALHVLGFTLEISPVIFLRGVRISTSSIKR